MKTGGATHLCPTSCVPAEPKIVDYEVSVMKENGSATNEEQGRYLTQAEVAERFKRSEGTIINWRKAGMLSFFRPPGTRSVLYLKSEIEDFENQHTTIRKGGGAKAKPKPTKKKPDVSTTPSRKWGI